MQLSRFFMGGQDLSEISTCESEVSLSLVLVASGTQEVEVLEAGLGAVQNPATRYVPVLDRMALREPLLKTLDRAGRSYRLLSHAEWCASAVKSGAEDFPARATTTALLILPGTPDRLARLASAATGLVPHKITSARDLDFPEDGDVRDTEFFVLHPLQPKRSGIILTLLQEMFHRGLRFGVLPVEDTIEGRLWLLKATLVEVITPEHRSLILADTFAKQWGTSAPKDLATPDRLTAGTWRDQLSDVLMFIGHANGQDAGAGRDLILCTRPDSERKGISTETMPCFREDRCFRQKAGSGKTALVDPAAASTWIQILSGCNVYSPGRAWYDAQFGLTWRACQSEALAVIASAQMLEPLPELELLFLSLLYGGTPLGEAVRLVNECSHTMGVSEDFAESIGRHMLIGNPLLRFVPSIHKIEPEHSEECNTRISVVIDLPNQQLKEGAHIQIPLQEGIGAYPKLIDQSADIWCRGSVAPSGGVSTHEVLHLFLKSGSLDAATLKIRFDEQSSLEPFANCLDAFCNSVSFWINYLAAYSMKSTADGMDTDPFRQTRDALLDQQPQLAMAHSFLSPQKKVLLSAQSQPPTLTQGVLGMVTMLQSQYMDCAIEVCNRFGTLHYSEWQSFYQKGDRFGPVERCNCGQGSVWGTSYHSAFAFLDKRAIYECPVCGPVGEDNTRQLLDAIVLPKTTARGSDVVINIKCTAPTDELVVLELVGMLEDWSHERQMSSDRLKAIVEPGTRQELSVTVEIPVDLTVGVYQLAIVGILNGGLAIRRTMIHVTT